MRGEIFTGQFPGRAVHPGLSLPFLASPCLVAGLGIPWRVRNTTGPVQLIRMTGFQILNRPGRHCGMVLDQIGSDNRRSLEDEPSIDLDRNSESHGAGAVTKTRKPHGIGLAHDRQSCVQDGSGAYCHGADTGRIVHCKPPIKRKIPLKGAGLGGMLSAGDRWFVGPALSVRSLQESCYHPADSRARLIHGTANEGSVPG